MKHFILALFFALIIVSPANAQSTLALQEKCAQGAKKFFFERINSYGGKRGLYRDEGGLGSNKFESHYNKKLDKCFIRIESTYISKKDDDPIYYSIELFDVFEGKQYGCFWREQYKNINWRVTRCEVGIEKCTNEQEFGNLIRLYVGE
jgi:hypothetical protein